MIKFEKVSVKYVDEFFSLFEFTHTFDESTILIGDKLSGADTILRLLAKFDKAYTGNIFIDEANIKQIKDKDLNLAFVSEEPYIFKFRSLEYNLSFPLKIRKVSKSEIKSVVNLAVSKYSLDKFPKKMRKLTLSQKKIVSLIRAVIRRPKILLLEYFFENLDSEFFELAKQIIKDFCPNSIIIACENKILDYFENFKQLNFSYGSIKN